MVTLHSNILVSSTRPAENPSTGFLQRSAYKRMNNQQTGSIRYETLCVSELKKDTNIAYYLSAVSEGGDLLELKTPSQLQRKEGERDRRGRDCRRP